MHRASEVLTVERRMLHRVENYGDGVHVGDRSVKEIHSFPKAQGGTGVGCGKHAHEACDDGRRTRSVLSAQETLAGASMRANVQSGCLEQVSTSTPIPSATTSRRSLRVPCLR